LYQRGGQLVRLTRPARPPGVRDRVQHSGGLIIEALPLADLRARITRYVAIMAWRKENIVPVGPPKWLTEGIAVQASPWIGVRPLESVTETPLLKHDGTILQLPGYDADTGILYVPQGQFDRVPEHPTRDDAIRARDELLEVVVDFPFSKPMHLSAWLASVLT